MPQNPGLKAAEPALSLDGLDRRREGLRVEIRERRQGLLDLVVELRQLDEAIRQADRSPQIVPTEADIAGRSIADAGGISHLVIEAFRDRPQALTSRDIALRLAAKLGFDAGNRAIMKYMTQRVCTCLWTLQQTGVVTKQKKTPGYLQLWECAPELADHSD